MCYYNTIYTKKKKNIVVAKETINIPAINLGIQSGFTHCPWPIIITENKKAQLQIADWGFLPSSIQNNTDIKNFRQQFNTLNAKIESLQQSKLYCNINTTNKCILPSSGFIEWQHNKLGNSKQINKIPFFISPTNQDDLFWMCGLFNKHFSKENKVPQYTFTILTTSANKLMETIHNTQKRMPCILTEENASKWLQNEINYNNNALPENKMKAITIAKDFMKMDLPLQEVTYQLVQQGSLF